VEGTLGAADCWRFRERRQEAALQGARCFGTASPASQFSHQGIRDLSLALGEAKLGAYGQRASVWSPVAVCSGWRGVLVSDMGCLR